MTASTASTPAGEAALVQYNTSLKATRDAFELSTEDLGRQYFERFDDICHELRHA